MLSQHKWKNTPNSFVLCASFEVLTVVVLKTQKYFGILHHDDQKIVADV
jgi:hypothetical protein